MIIERIIFNVAAFVLFTIIFLKMIQKNDTSYIYTIIMQAIGIAIGFIGLIFRINLPLLLIMITYVISIIIPIAIIIFENKGLYLPEIISFNVAKYYILKRNLDKAKEIINNAIEKYPNSYFLHKLLGEINEKNGNKDIAIDEYIKAYDRNKSKSDLSIKAAELLKNTERKDDAIKLLNELLIKKPDCYEASCLLGDILYEKENYKEAVNVYMQALNYNPDKYELYYNLGMTFTRLNDFQSAKEYYEKAAQLNSLLYNAKFNLGQIALLYNEIDEAEKEFNECIEAEYLADEVYYYLGYISILKGNKEEAVNYLNIAVEENEELYEKACKEDAFRIIIHKIKRPTNTQKQKNKNKITLKEIQTMEHLQKTCEIVSDLNKKDIRKIKTIRESLENKYNDKER